MNWFKYLVTAMCLLLTMGCQNTVSNKAGTVEEKVENHEISTTPPQSVQDFYDRMTTTPDQIKAPIAFVVKRMVDQVVRTERRISDFSYYSEIQDSNMLFLMNIPTLSFLAPDKRHHSVSLVEKGLSTIGILKDKSINILILENYEPKFLKTPNQLMDTTNLDLTALNHFLADE